MQIKPIDGTDKMAALFGVVASQVHDSTIIINFIDKNHSVMFYEMVMAILNMHNPLKDIMDKGFNELQGNNLKAHIAPEDIDYKKPENEIANYPYDNEKFSNLYDEINKKKEDDNK